MDPETSRLVMTAIITATAAIIAGVGGATLTAMINRKNTTDTLAAAREDNEIRWHREVSREKELWLRDTKQQAYAKFVSAVTAAASNAYTIDPTFARNALVAFDEVRLVAPREVRKAGKKLTDQIVKIGGLISTRFSTSPEPDANEDALRVLQADISQAIEELGRLTRVFVFLARQDTGAEPEAPENRPEPEDATGFTSSPEPRPGGI
ncbi:hypothetical protein [Paenarthrobacter sp. 22069]|uniref:hypothetical protein n=1 Tax=Paenarthrobacter sp. 22069 TaxID=3453864 RepID=UPI003F86D9E6